MSTKNYGFKRAGFSRHGLNALRQYSQFKRSPNAELTASMNAVSKQGDGLIYNEFRMGFMVTTIHTCAKCGSAKIRRNGHSGAHARYQCKACGY